MDIRSGDDAASGAARCAVQRRAVGADPVGSAGHYDAFVVVESPLPWARDATGCWPFTELGWSGAATTGADARSWRPMVVAPSGAAPDRVAVTVWERPNGSVAPFVGHRGRIPRADVPAVVEAVVGSPGAVGLLDRPAPPVLMVCAHGRRDVCCGSLGTRLAAGLPAGPDGTEILRCSHTGGHRFAPTALTFPDGLAWAHLDPALAAELRNRERPPSAAVLAACRGAAQLPAGPAQVADREALAAFGWRWVGSQRSVEVRGESPHGVGDPPVEVHVEGPVGSGTVVVEVAAAFEVPPCGTPAGTGAGDETEAIWRVVDVALRPTP